MKIGFTGSRNGMSNRQKLVFTSEITDADDNNIGGITEFHHGDCKGADEWAHDLVFGITKAKIVVHPPKDPKDRAFVELHEDRVVAGDLSKDYLDRNHDIVNRCDVLLACPAQIAEVTRGSGTWATIRYAQKIGKPVVIIQPDGKIKRL